MHVEIFSSKDLGLDAITIPSLPIPRWSSLPEDAVAFKSRKNPSQTKENISGRHLYVDVTVKNQKRKFIKFGLDTRNIDKQRRMLLAEKCQGTQIRNNLSFFFKVRFRENKNRYTH